MHWLISHIPATATSLREAIPPKKALEHPVSADQGRNSFRGIGYGGPLPPPKHGPHHYIFKLYALDRVIPLKSGFTKDALLSAMEGHTLEVAQLIGTYQRKKGRQAA